MGFFRSVMFAIGLTAAGLAGCEESSKPPAARQDAGIDARVDADNNERRDAARPVNDAGYRHDVYDEGSDDAYDAAQLFDTHDAHATDARRIEDVFDAAREVGYDAQRADAHDAAYADAQSDAGNPSACPPWHEREFYNGEGAAGVGICLAGLERCLPQPDGLFAYVTIRDQIGPRREACNYEDDDCDTEVDEGTRRMFYRDEDHDGHGTELDAIPGCEQPDGYVGRAGDCDDRNNQVNPDAPEWCNQRDDNCEGAQDEGCECAMPEVRACGDPIVGECREGVQICDFDGNWSECFGYRGPEPERCDEKDNSCDGQTDEGYDLGVECLVGIGACGRSGVTVCTDDGLETRCSARPGQPQAEKCDGTDANCDGVQNDGYDVGAACAVGVGACRAEGVKVCDLNLDARVTRCDAPIIEPQPEVCADGIDQDCDREVDNELVCQKFLIAYICSGQNKDICVVDSDGQNKRVLVSQPGNDWNHEESNAPTIPLYPLSWSPDGTSILFTNKQSPDRELIQQVNIRNGQIELLVDPQDISVDIWKIEYSPDGTQFAFSEYSNVGGGGARVRVYTFDAEEITHEFQGTRSVWHPDGRLAYREWPRGIDYFINNLQGGESNRMTNNGGINSMFRFSPDGNHALHASLGANDWDIWYLNVQTGEQRILINSGTDEYNPVWLPDSEGFVYVKTSRDSGKQVLVLTSLNGNPRDRELTNNATNSDEPAVSTDGREVAYRTDRHGTMDLYKIDLETDQETRLTSDPGDEEAPVFAPVQR